MAKKEESEFIATQDLDLYTKDGEPSASGEGTIAIKIKKGNKIPILFIPLFLKRNRNFIVNLGYKDGIPQLTAEQEKKYGITFKQVIHPLKIKKDKYTQENLTQKLNKLGATKFKAWAEKEFGEDTIDRRKSGRSIIVQILKLQEEGRR